MAKLYFKYGAMGSSKTAQALITKYNYEENDLNAWLIKPSAPTWEHKMIKLHRQPQKNEKEKSIMELSDILAKCDHTLLAQAATWEEIKAICDDGIKYGCASVCIPAAHVKQAKEYVDDKLSICTVIGFPNGYATTAAKCFMASDAVDNGADEVDMVINIGWAKEGLWADITAEIAAIKASCKGKLLKVIIETCLLSDDEKIALCKCVSDSGADYIKTSTGFSKAGATFHDVELFAKHVAPHVKIKAAGGISSLEDAEKFIQLGAERLGTSRIVKIAKGLENDGTY